MVAVLESIHPQRNEVTIKELINFFVINGEGWEPVNFFLLISLLSSFLFWSVDEFLKSNMVKQIRTKIDDLRIY